MHHGHRVTFFLKAPEIVVGGERVDQSVPARQDLTAKHRLAEPLTCRREGALVNRASGKPEVVGAIVERRGGLRVGVPRRDTKYGVAQQPIEGGAVGGFDVRDVRKLQPHTGRDGGLMRATLRCQGHATGRSGNDEPRSRVHRIDEGIQAAEDEWVVHRSDGNERLTGQIPRKPQLTEQQEQVHLRDSQFDVLALRAFCPLHHRVLGPLVLLHRAEHADLVDEAAQVCTRRDVGGGSDHVGA